MAFSGGYVKGPCHLWQGGSGAHRRTTARREGVDRPRGGRRVLDSLGNPNTIRSYGIGVGKTAERLGEARPLASIADIEIDEALELLWGTAAVNTWNSRRAGCCPGRRRTPSPNSPAPQPGDTRRGGGT